MGPDCRLWPKLSSPAARMQACRGLTSPAVVTAAASPSAPCSEREATTGHHGSMTPASQTPAARLRAWCVPSQIRASREEVRPQKLRLHVYPSAGSCSAACCHAVTTRTIPSQHPARHNGQVDMHQCTRVWAALQTQPRAGRRAMIKMPTHMHRPHVNLSPNGHCVPYL